MKGFRLVGLAVASLMFGPDAVARADPRYDLLIKGGLVFDGSLNAPVIADVAVTGDQIVLVGTASEEAFAARVIEAKGLWVTPGFIDPHTHYLSDLTSEKAEERAVAAALLQGVTTVFVGNDGTSSSKGIGASFAKARAEGIGPNMASYLGFGTVRRAVVGLADRPATEAEMDEMTAMVRAAMCEGAIGLSTGLFYAPQSYAPTQEVIALAQEVQRHGGIYDTHLRDESSYGIGLKAAVAEALDIGRATGVPVHIAHIKALGVDVHGMAAEVIAQIEAAQGEGLSVHADQYPWEASGTSLAAALLPRWAQADGRRAMVARLDHAEQGPRVRAEMADNMRRRGGAEALLLTAGAPAEVRGKTLAEAAAHWGTDPIEAAVLILKRGGSSIASFNQTEADIAAFMVQPWVMTSSDASGGHPRKYASFARLYDHYVKGEGVLSAAQFVHRSTARTAQAFGLEGRGRLQAGAFADIAVFDPEGFAPKATYVEPEKPAVGMTYVVVNGQLVVSEGGMQDRLAGKPLPRGSKLGCLPAL